jgi:hypothetical protein
MLAGIRYSCSTAMSVKERKKAKIEINTLGFVWIQKPQVSHTNESWHCILSTRIQHREEHRDASVRPVDENNVIVE